MFHRKRRRLLQAALGAGSALLPGTPVFAQANRTLSARERGQAGAQGSGSLAGTPRRALVIGNSAYGFSPLKNPANDARAIAQALDKTGFRVQVAVDLERAAMLEAMAKYAAELERSKEVGLFFFAGHGVQLAWRNYLLPIDAKVARMEDIQQSCVDLNSLIEGIGRAANPMNVVILDACRDNPFGRDFRVEQPGLSQLDAPPGTFLAYATSPGNVASDGAGANGLYTEYLLREMRVPEAKIEDVFKRVRLGVRRTSNGRQIPWESTSLEQDFWFIPPEAGGDDSAREAEEAFRRELALWERVSDATSPAPLEQYLRRYPNGRFSELAQFRLDRVLAAEGEKPVEVVSSPQNPYSQGFARADTHYKVGDSYTINELDLFSGRLDRTYTLTVTAIRDGRILFNDGAMVTDLLGNYIRLEDGRSVGPNQILPTEFAVGKRWTTRWVSTLPNGRANMAELDLRIVGREKITVPAGTFNAFRVDGEGTSYGTHGSTILRYKWWFAPEQVRRPVAAQDLRQNTSGRYAANRRLELASFRQG